MTSTNERRHHNPDVDPAPRRAPVEGEGAQAGAAGAGTPEAPRSPRPSQNAPTDDDGTTERRALVVAILRTLPPALLAPVLAALVAWLYALDAAARVLRQCTGQAAQRTAHGIADAAATALLESDDGPDDTEHQVNALAGVWFHANPYGIARELHTHDRGGDIAAALADVDHARELLCAAPDAPPSTSAHPVVRVPFNVAPCCHPDARCTPCASRAADVDGSALRALVRDAARMLHACGSTAGNAAQLGAELATFAAGKGCGTTLVFMCGSLAEIAAEYFEAAWSGSSPGFVVDPLARCLAAAELAARCAALVRALAPELPTGLDPPPFDSDPSEVVRLDGPALDPWGSK